MIDSPKIAEFAGLLRERIRITRQGPGRDASGSADGEMVAVGDFWAAMAPLGAGASTAADSRTALPRWRCTLRQTDRIKPGDEVQWGARKMTIQSVLSDHRLIPRTIIEAEENRV